MRTAISSPSRVRATATVLLMPIALLPAASLAAAPRRHDLTVAVPAPGPVTVDGDLADWDTSGEIECAYDEALRPRFVVRVCFMYDADALYVGARFADDSPLLNRHDPAVEPGLGWAGDCLQVRLSSDPRAPYPLPHSNSDRVCHLTIWHYTDGSLPVLHAQYGMDYHGTRVWTGADSGVAFRRAEGGYVIEARVPWSRLNAARSAPAAGDEVALTIQPLWSDASGWRHAVSFCDVVRQSGFSFQDPGTWGKMRLSKHGNLARQERPKTTAEKLAPLSLELPGLDERGTCLSAGVFAADGTLVRTLPVVVAEAGAGLPREIEWDGLDDHGSPLAVGRYTVKALTHRGVGQRYVTSLHNAGTPPWRTDDGRGSWGGDHGAPIAAAADGERVYLGWELSEAGWAIIGVEPRPTSRTSAQKLWGQHQVLEIGMIVTAMASDGERLFVAQDGASWGESEAASKAGVVLWEAATGRPVNFPFGQRILRVAEWDPRGKEGFNLRGVAVAGDRLFASLFHENRIVVFDWKTGERVRDIALEMPGGLAADGGVVYAISGTRVVRIDPGPGTATPVVTAGLSAPRSVAARGGALYVTDRGDAMQVKIFRGGRQVGAIGRRGGRARVGRFEPDGMLNPEGVAVDREGRVWVAEYDHTPKRVSVWSARGELVADLLGAGAYAVDGTADEANPRLVNTHDTLFEVDYATGAWKVLTTLVRGEPGDIGGSGGFMGRSLFFRHAGGRDWLVRRGHGLIVLYELGKDLVGRPRAATGYLKDGHLYGIGPEHVGQEAWDDRFARGFRWVDSNRDSKGQPAEFAAERMKAPPWGSYWGPWVDKDLTIWSSNQESKAVWRIPVKEWTPDGLPVYPAPGEQAPLFTLGDTAEIHYVIPGRKGVYVLENTRPGAGQDGTGGAISLCGLDGRRRWSYRRVWTSFGLGSPLSQPGDVCGAMRFIGTAELDGGLELVAVNCYHGYFAVMCDEGLWVASLCKDNRYGPKADEITVWPENFSGSLFRNREDGKVYLLAGDTDARIWEVTGLEHLRVARREFELSAKDREKAVAAAVRSQGVAASRPPIRLTPAAKIAVDGALDDWDMTDAAEIDAGPGRGARVRMASDGANLFVVFDVDDDSPMRNSGGDAALLFKTGDACDVMLAAEPGADAGRRAAAKGDLRLLFSTLNDVPVAVLYEPLIRTGERAERVFSSPTGALTFERVTTVEGARVAVRRREAGYVLEASVPLSALGFVPSPGMLTRGDVGVIFSDPGGSRNVLRAYYVNSQTAIVNDIPSEARLEPHNWGAIEVAR